MRIRIFSEQELGDRVNYTLRSLRCCGRVEVVQWAAARLRCKDRICGANLCWIKLPGWGVPGGHAPAGATGGAAASSAVGLIPFSARIGA